jgi:uncharacterized coiled-coil protein SlyX
MSDISDDFIKKLFPWAFCDEEACTEDEKAFLCRTRETIRTRLDMDRKELAKTSTEMNFSANERFLYSALITHSTEQSIKIALLKFKVECMEEDFEEIKKIVQPLPVKETPPPPPVKAKPSLKRKIKK